MQPNDTTREGKPHDDMIERTAIVAYGIVRELHQTLTRPGDGDEVTLGILMGLSMFLDEMVGPFRTRHLMTETPGVILKTDAHVTEDLLHRFMPVLRAFGEHLSALPAPSLPAAGNSPR